MNLDRDRPPVPDHLFTWVDIDEYFAALAAGGMWASWLLEVDAYWDAVELTVVDGTEIAVVWQWLATTLGPLTVDPQRQVVLLESVDGAGEPLPVLLRCAQRVADPDRRPRWNERRIVAALAGALRPPVSETFPHGIPVCAFHSFKGGTGRTLHCLALARELADPKRGQPAGRGRVLLVDADVEAPGITWMLASQGHRIDFALKDLLALLHGSPAQDARSVLALARKFLVNQELDGVVVLPATRDPVRLGPLRIEPADLLTPERPPYFLTDMLAELAYAVGAGSVLVDLRAGVSELSAPVLLDPRVHRVFVTTVSDQSVRGTGHLIREIAHRAPSRRGSDPPFSVLVTQFQEEERRAHLVEVAATLAEALAFTVRPPAAEIGEVGLGRETVDRYAPATLLGSPFDSRLLALPGTWNDVCDLVETVELRTVVASLADALHPAASVVSGPAAAGRFGANIGAARRALADRASRLIFAENAVEEHDFLPTEALVNLVSTHRTEAPVEIVVGATGSGKTFTYLHMCRQETWASFAGMAEVDGVELDAPMVPVLASQNLDDRLRGAIVDVQQRSADRLTGAAPATFLDIRELITESVERELSDTAWRRVWLTCFARAAGLDVTPDTAEDALTTLARGHRAVFVLDGLEDLFQRFSSDDQQQRALRALLTGCPEWFRSLRGRPLGLVVFVRRDLVLNAIQQNADQFFARHQAYELRWNRTDALRLAAWVCARAEVLRPGDAEQTRTASSSSLSRVLTQLWGRKLGADTSREARSEDWFFAALSDFNLQIQARDIVSFLAEAARQAGDDERHVARWSDRLLPPAAMRRALPACSREKIQAMAQENRPVGELFERLRQVSEPLRKVPFTADTVGLAPAEARLLEANGVLFREEDQYWIPEIYRHELGFSGIGRPKVLAVARLIHRRNDPT